MKVTGTIVQLKVRGKIVYGDAIIIHPILISAIIEDATPAKIILTYDLALDENSIPAITDFVITGKTVSLVEVSGFTVTVTVNEDFIPEEIITIDYTAGTNLIRSDIKHVNADDLIDEPVTNNYTWETYLGIYFGDELFYLNGEIFENGGNYYYKDKTANNRHFLITGLDWSDDSRVSNILPFKTFATISAPAGNSALIAADVDNFLYDAVGTPNQITPQMLFQNIDYKNKLFCRFVDHVLDVDNKETTYSGVKDIVLYDTAKTGADLTTCNTYFSVPVKLTSDVIWIGKDGNDTTGNGTEALPYLTINKAQSVISAGQTKTIYIKTGDYDVTLGAYDYLYFNYKNATITFYGLGRVRWTSANATYICRKEGTGTLHFTRIYMYGTKTTPLITTYNADKYNFNYCEINCTTSSAATLYSSDIYRSKIKDFWSITCYSGGTSTINESIIKDKGLVMTNYDIVGRKSSITYSKVLNSTSNNSVNFIGTFFDYNYNISYISGAGYELQLAYYSVTRGDCNITYNEHNQNYCGTLIHNQNNPKFHAFTLSYNRVISSLGGNYMSAMYTQHFTAEHNYMTSPAAFSAINLIPEVAVSTAISIKYNTILTKSVANDAIINLSEAGIANVFDGAEIMYNILKGGIVDYPLLTMNCHGILARNGKNMKIAYNWVENCVIGIVYKTENIANTSGGIYGNVLINNRVSIYLRANNAGRVYGNVMYQTNSATNTNSYFITADTQGSYVCTNCYFENNIMYRNNSPAATSLFYIQATSLAAGTKIKNNIVYSPDTAADYWLYDLASNYTLAQCITNGYAENINVIDPVISASVPYPVPAIEGATDLGDDFDEGLDISSEWAEDVVLKEQGANWQYGAYVQ